MMHKYNLAIVTTTEKIPYQGNPVELWDIPKIVVDSHAVIGFLGVYVEPILDTPVSGPPVRIDTINAVPLAFDGTYETTEEQKNASLKNHEVNLSGQPSNSGV